MEWIDRAGSIVPGDAGQDRLLETLYGSFVGRAIVSIMIRPWVSKAAGCLLSTRLSALGVKPFVKKNNIPMEEYEQSSFRSFNDFFTRRIRPDMRPVDHTPHHLIAPCDSKLSVYPIEEDSRFLIKNTRYTLESLLRSPELAEHYRGGTLLLFRLTVGDYHRYCFPDSGTPEPSVRIPGVYHTVNPAANDRYPVYKENAREYTVFHSEHFGQMLLMEVGAAMVGRIANLPVASPVSRGQEKGMFEFGGSTVLVLLEKGRAIIDDDIRKNTVRQAETVVKQGEKIGQALPGKD